MFGLLKFKEDAHAVSESTAFQRTAIPEGTPLEQLRAELLELMGQETINHHRMGEIYNHIVAKKLAEKAGFTDARAYFSQHLADLSQSSLTMYGAVAAEFSEPVARRFGVTCLSLLLGYKEAADVEVNRDEPGSTVIEVPDLRHPLIKVRSTRGRRGARRQAERNAPPEGAGGAPACWGWPGNTCSPGGRASRCDA